MGRFVPDGFLTSFKYDHVHDKEGAGETSGTVLNCELPWAIPADDSAERFAHPLDKAASAAKTVCF
jgi:hypothetical protein